MAAIGYSKVSVPTSYRWYNVGRRGALAKRGTYVIPPIGLSGALSALLHTGGANGRSRTPSAVSLATAEQGCAWGPRQGSHLCWKGLKTGGGGLGEFVLLEAFPTAERKLASSWSLRLRKKRISRKQLDTASNQPTRLTSGTSRALFPGLSHS